MRVKESHTLSRKGTTVGEAADEEQVDLQKLQTKPDKKAEADRVAEAERVAADAARKAE